MKFGSLLLLLIAAQYGAFAGERTPGPKSAATNAIPTVELRGQIVCLSEEMRRLHGASVPDKHQHDYGFKSDSGFLYSLARTSLSEALLTDTNLLGKTFLLKGRIFPRTQIFEVTGNVHTLKAGKVFELFYYCDICSIKSSVPGPCMCCREPVHLVEEPGD